MDELAARRLAKDSPRDEDRTSIRLGRGKKLWVLDNDIMVITNQDDAPGWLLALTDSYSRDDA